MPRAGFSDRVRALRWAKARGYAEYYERCGEDGAGHGR